MAQNWVSEAATDSRMETKAKVTDEDSDDSGMSCEEGSTEASTSPVAYGQLKLEIDHEPENKAMAPSSAVRKSLESTGSEQPLDFSVKAIQPPVVGIDTPVIQANPNHPANSAMMAAATTLLQQRLAVAASSHQSAFDNVGNHVNTVPMLPPALLSALRAPPLAPPQGDLGLMGMNPLFNPFLAGLLPQLNVHQQPQPPPPAGVFGANGCHEPSLKLTTPGSGFLDVKQQGGGKPTTRPFKAYNPGDPLSALQITVNPHSMPNLPTTAGFNQLSTDSLMRQYREFMANAQNILTGRANRPVTTTTSSSDGDSGSTNCTTPSPPQVTSTSHPHTAIDRRLQQTTAGGGGDNSSHQPSSSPSSDNDLHQAQPQLHLPLANSLSMPSVIRSSFQQHSTVPATTAASVASVNAPPSVASSGGGSTIRKKSKTSVSLQPSQQELVKDDAYWERRRKNNDAAKRSRDSRRQKEDEIAMRAAILEQENIRLRIELAQLKSETDKLRNLLVHP